eukprot:COSAG02_NODE_7537_length_2969_cov_24.612892_5_plen_215_part_01
MAKPQPQPQVHPTTMATVLEEPQPQLRRRSRSAPRTGRPLAELHAAVVRGEIDTVRRMVCVRGGCDGDVTRELVNEKDGHGDTALTKCARRGHVNVARLLLDAGAKVDAQNAGGYSALMLACYWNHSEMVNLLLSKGADATMRSSVARECAACSVGQLVRDTPADERTDLHARQTGVAVDGLITLDKIWWFLEAQVTQAVFLYSHVFIMTQLMRC